MTFLLLFLSGITMQGGTYIPPNSEYISYSGRFDTHDTTQYVCSFSTSTIQIRTNSTYIDASIYDYAVDSNQPNYIEIIVDNAIYATIKLTKGLQIYRIFESDSCAYRTISIVKRTEGQIGNIGFKGFVINQHAGIQKIEKSDLRMLFIGNSITCGYGNEALHAESPFESATENAYMSYAAIAARTLNAEYHTISYSGKGVYRNWADTTILNDCMPEVFERTFCLRPSPLWNHSLFIPSIIVINLGTNDFSPPIGANKHDFVKYYTAFITRLSTLYPEAQIICVVSQMLEGESRKNLHAWLHEIQKMYTYKNMYVCELSQQGRVGFGADWHPNIAQNKINAQELVDFIEGN